jgi:hypothetical protein
VVPGQPRKKVHKIPSQSLKEAGWFWYELVIPTTAGSINSRIVVQVSSDIKARPYSKNN